MKPWETNTLGNLFDIGAGKSVTPVSRLTTPQFPFLRTANVFWGRIDLSQVDTMHFTSQELSEKALRPGIYSFVRVAISAAPRFGTRSFLHALSKTTFIVCACDPRRQSRSFTGSTSKQA